MERQPCVLQGSATKTANSDDSAKISGSAKPLQPQTLAQIADLNHQPTQEVTKEPSGKKKKHHPHFADHHKVHPNASSIAMLAHSDALEP